MRPKHKTTADLTQGQCLGYLPLQSPKYHSSLLGPEMGAGFFSTPSPLSKTCPVPRQTASHWALWLPLPGLPSFSCVPVTHAHACVSNCPLHSGAGLSPRDREPQEFRNRALKPPTLCRGARPGLYTEHTSLPVILQSKTQGRQAV